jgi:hypothetical protein
MNKISYTAEQSLTDPKYSAYYHEFFRGYEGNFGQAEKIDVDIAIIPQTMLNQPQRKLFRTSEGGRNVKISIDVYPSYSSNIHKKIPPSPEDLFETLKKSMDQAVKEYLESL